MEDSEKETTEISELERLYGIKNKEERFDFASRTLKAYKGIESNIPVFHPYWKIRP